MPHRLPFVINTWFDAATQPMIWRFHVPLLYAGRVTLCSLKNGPVRSPDEIEILEMMVSNPQGAARKLPPTDFYKDDQGNLVSPVLFLV